MKKSSNLLIDEAPLQVLPSLAARIGLNEAIVLQQIQYWTKISGHKRDGRVWIYNSAKAWQEQFPFWSIRTIERIIASLREKKLILTANYNAAKFDKTLWYSIDYDAVSDAPIPTNWRDETDKLADSYSDKLTVPIPEITETTTEKKISAKKTAEFPGAFYEQVETAFATACDARIDRAGKKWVNTAVAGGRAALIKLFRAGEDPAEVATRASCYAATADGKYRPFSICGFVANYNNVAIRDKKEVERDLAADGHWK